jgi:hypothetical protein
MQLEAWTFFFVFLCRDRPLRRAGHLSKGVLLSVLTRLRNLRCEAAEFLTRTVEPLIMMMMMSENFSTAFLKRTPP